MLSSIVSYDFMWLSEYIWDNQITRTRSRDVNPTYCTNLDKSDNEGKVKGINILVTKSLSNNTYLILVILTIQNLTFLLTI